MSHTSAGIPTRTEHDGLGEVEVPADRYYGANTARALANFPISGVAINTYPDLIVGLAAIKHACAAANAELGDLDLERARAIQLACDDLRAGLLHQEFVVDVLQGGAGTSTNMNANEVIANRGLEHLGLRRGDYAHLHPLDHVNRSQSTNDVYPTAARLGLCLAGGRLASALELVSGAFAKKAREFDGVVKVGRTQLQDAVPMTLGQELRAFSVTVAEDRDRLLEAVDLVKEVNLGGTAIGTGLNTHPRFAALAHERLVALSGVPLLRSSDLVEATQDMGAYVQLSGVLKRIAVKLSKICNDLRLLASGPRAGLGELLLPAVQAGSSIMPGKVNPVIPEVVNQIAFEVIGNDVAIAMGAEAGQLQLNAFGPLMVHKLFDGTLHLTAGCNVLVERCIKGIACNEGRIRASVESSIGLATALVPHAGYDISARVAAEALASGRNLREVAVEVTGLDETRLAELLDPARFVVPASTMSMNDPDLQP